MVSDGQAAQFRTIASGHWHPPGSSRRENAVLMLNSRTLLVKLADRLTGDPVALNDFDAVEISDRIGRIPRRVGFKNGSLFETQDNDAIDRLLQGRRRNASGFIHQLERFHPRLLLMVLAVFMFAGGIYRYALPAMVEVAVAVTPDIVPDMLSDGTLSSLDNTVFDDSELPEERRKAIQAGFDELASHAEGGINGYDLQFRKGGPIGPNAFALPSGTLVLTDELVELSGGDDSMILGVLAHEIGHVDLKHSLRELYRAVGTAGLIMLIAGDVGTAMEDILTNAVALVSLSYTRDAETAADRYSVDLMHKAGQDPAAIGRFFGILEEKLKDRGETSIFSTHPGTPDRRKQIDEWAREVQN